MKKLTSISTNVSLVDGKIVFKNRRYFDGMLSLYEDCEHATLTLERQRGTRSKRANAYYWGVVLPLIGEHVGELPEELHETMKSLFLRKKRLWRGGEITTLKSTASLTTDEFMEYVEQVRREGMELGVITPDPDPEHRAHRDFPESLK